MKRITENLKTTIVGCIIIVAGLVMLYLGKIDATGFTIMAGFGTGLLFSKDPKNVDK